MRPGGARSGRTLVLLDSSETVNDVVVTGTCARERRGVRRPAVGLLVLLGAFPALADGSRARPDIDVIVPVAPIEHERLHWFGRRDHHLVPGTVTIDGAPYLCDVDGKRFTD